MAVRPLLPAVALALLLALPASAYTVDPLRTPHVVYGARASDLAARGIAVTDDYGAFATAALTGSQVTSLRADGFLPVALDLRSGRGAYVGDLAAGGLTIPARLRTTTDDPVTIVQFRGP